MSRQTAFVAMAGLLVACGPADVDYMQTARETCVSGAYRDAGADGAVVDAVLDERAYCRVTCADGWGTCSSGPACAQAIHTDTDCARCGDRCGEGQHCTHIPAMGSLAEVWTCLPANR